MISVALTAQTKIKIVGDHFHTIENSAIAYITLHKAIFKVVINKIGI